MNIDKYLDGAKAIGEGYVYKDEHAFESNPNAICYISEGCLQNMEESKEEGIDIDDEHIKLYYGETRNSIRHTIAEWLQNNDINATAEEVGEKGLDKAVFQSLDWQCLETYLCESIDNVIETFDSK